LIVEVDGGQHKSTKSEMKGEPRGWNPRAIAYCVFGTTRCCRTWKASWRQSAYRPCMTQSRLRQTSIPETLQLHQPPPQPSPDLGGGGAVGATRLPVHHRLQW
jgi:hypothetical protein